MKAPQSKQALKCGAFLMEVLRQRGKQPFRFDLYETVEIGISGERGYVKGCAEYLTASQQYLVHYKSADGRAVEAWFGDEDLAKVEPADSSSGFDGIKPTGRHEANHPQA